MDLRRRCQDLVTRAGLDWVEIIEHHALIHVDTHTQVLTWTDISNRAAHQFPVSTSRYGLGQTENSLQTPTGIHRIAQKIGDQEPLGRVFKARLATDEICLPADFDGDRDVISSRILWLSGMQAGFNHGGEVDSFNRYIYIHGTPDEAHIGQPASIGCIRMRNRDVIDLFDRVAIGDPVIIE